MSDLRLLTVTEAADLLGRSRDFVKTLIAAKTVPARKINRRWYIARRHLTQWIADGMQDPGEVPPIAPAPPRKWLGDAA